MKRNRKDGLREYLASNGGFEESANDEFRESLRKAYYRFYKAQWRKQNRAEMTYCTIVLSETQKGLFLYHAKHHKRPLTKLILEAAEKYFQQKYLVPDIELVHSFRKLLAVGFIEMSDILHTSALGNREIEHILLILQRHEQQIIEGLINPPLLLAKVKDAMESDRNFRIQIHSLLNSEG